MTDLINQGWLRVRFVGKKDSFTVQVPSHRLSKRQEDTLRMFAQQAIEGIPGSKPKSQYSLMTIMDLNAIPIATHTLKELSEDILFKNKAARLRVISIQEYIPRKATIIQKVLAKLFPVR
jgi:hypothetical protein